MERSGKRTEPTSIPPIWNAVFTGVGLGAINSASVTFTSN